jgi:uncharacterized membrane protein
LDVVAGLLKLAHIALAMAFAAGIVGRGIVLRRAARAAEVDRAAELTELAGPFERTAVLASMAVLPAGLATAWAQGYPWLGLTTGWMLVSLLIYVALTLLVPTIFVPRGRRFEAALADARRGGQMTPELRAAFEDPAVRFARNAEIAGLAVIVALMVLKPF